MIHFPKIPNTQVLSSKTFSRPPLDGSLTLPELCDWHLEHSPEHPIFIYAQQTGELQTITWARAAKAILTGARLVRQKLGWRQGMTGTTPVVAILSASETISYSTLELAILRAGYTVFPISVRNSPAAVAHLIHKVDVSHVFVGREQAAIDLKDKALKILSEEKPSQSMPTVSPIPIFEDLYTPSKSDDENGEIPFEKKDLDDIAIYLHSSGSTSFPKPIPWTHHRLLLFAMFPYFGERDLTGVNLCASAIPMYHTMGNAQICWTAATGLVLSTYEPKTPPTVPTPQNALEGAMACHSELLLSVPAFIEEWSRIPEYVKWLSTTSGVLYGGGPLAKDAGDYLTSQGVQIFNLYGLTEIGALTSVLPVKFDPEWEVFSFSKALDIEMVPQGDGLYECVFVANAVCQPSVVNTQVNGADAYATSDLFSVHPQRPGCWKMYGRKDDQIMHSTGEKTNPGPLEHIINQDPLVRSSIIFGRGQLRAGVIIDPQPDFSFDPEDQAQLDGFRDKIWPTIQRMNEFAPQHSRLFKEMITVAKPSKPFQYTAKNTPRRQVIIRAYDDEIKELYAAVDENSQSSGVAPPRTWEDEAVVLEFVRIVVGKVLPQSVKDTDDIFQHGCDSLQATWIRNTIIKALRESTSVDAQHVMSANVIYDYPTLACLASFLTKVAAGSIGTSGTDIASRVAAMRAMVEKYTMSEYPIIPSRFDQTVALNAQAAGGGNDGVVLVTGTTGGLGCYLLAELIANPDVSRVYAVNRGKDLATLHERQRKALAHRGYGADVVDGMMSSEKLVLLPADTSAFHFGLGDDEYEQLRSSVTHIIHNAWPVDFNLSLASFEPSIRGVRNLIELSLTSSHASPPSLVFASTIGMLQGVEPSPASRRTIPEKPIEAEQAVGNGYIEGKWVSEEILRYASSHTRMDTVVVRVGQLCGGANGSWNVAEWLPSLVQSAQTLGCLPTDDRNVDWFPVHVAAKVMIDYRSSGSSSLVHLVHPKPVSWASLASIASQDLSVPLVSYTEWLERLEAAAGGKSSTTSQSSNADNGVEMLRKIPALRLLPFYRSISATQRNDGNAFGLPRLACEEAVRLSKTMLSDGIVPLGESDVRSWIQFWREVGYIRS